MADPSMPQLPDAPDGRQVGPFGPSPGPLAPRRRSFISAALPWLLGIVVVVLLAASGGLVTAWLVASMRAVPPPAAVATPTPTAPPTLTSAPSAQPSAAPSDQPRHTPTPTPLITPEPEPFVHVVQRGEYLQYIADLYEVTVADIVALNDIRNPNRIRPGQQLLIPGYGIRPSPSPA